MQQPNILILGKSSFIGNGFCNYTQFGNCDKGSLREQSLDRFDFSGYDVLLHLPAIVHQSSRIPYEKYYQVNAELAYQAALKAKREGVKQFVFFSTIRIYGEYTKDGTVWNEGTAPNPTDNYGKSKLEAEKMLRTLADTDFHIAILRIPMVYGPGNRGNLNKMIAFIKKYRIAPFLNIPNKRNILYIKNLAGFIDQLILQDQDGTFLVTDPEPVSTSEIARSISKYLDKRVFLSPIPGFVRILFKNVWPSGYFKVFGNLELDNRSSFEQLDYHPQYNFDQGMKEMMAWFKDN